MPSMESSTSMISPNTPMRRVEVTGRSGPATVPMQKGISEIWVIPCAPTTSQNRLEDHLGISTAVAPTPRTEKNDQLWAFTWKRGR